MHYKNSRFEAKPLKIMRDLMVIITALLLISCNHDPRVTIKTDLGDIVVELYPDKAPVTVENFLRYVDEDRYGDGFE